MRRSATTRIATLLAAFVVLFTVLATASYTGKSATWDEPQHLTAGYLALRFRDFRADPEHPPLARAWAALPLLGMRQIRIDRGGIESSDPAAWVGRGQFDFAHRFLYVLNDADALLYRARFMIVVLGLVLGGLLFAWVREWFGLVPAAIALGAYCVEPNLLAHASLVTTDLAVTCAFFAGSFALSRVTRRITVGNLAGLGATCAVGVGTKFSALILLPIVVSLLLARALRDKPWPCAVVRSRDLDSRAGRVAMAGAIGAAVLVLAVAGVWAMYGFRFLPSDSAAWRFRFHDEPQVVERAPVAARIVGWIDGHRMLPNAYAEGFLLGQAKSRVRNAFLAGEISDRGWWYYFPVAFGVKTPLALLILLVAGVIILGRAPPSGRTRWDVVAGLVPVAAYLAAALTATLNIGLRHALPAYPFVLLVAAAAVPAARRPVAKVVLAVLATVWLAEFVRVYPHNLAFFNQFVGGPANGYRYLVDSNLDWGQDLKPLKRWMTETRVPHVNLAYFGTADPDYYGISCTYLPAPPSFAEDRVGFPRLPGYVAVSPTILNGVYLNEAGRSFYRPLLDREPVAVIGHSIRVYWMERPWW